MHGLKDTFLTDAQRRVLELRAQGYSQAQIARMLRTTRANISILEKRAREKIERARRTVEFAKKLESRAVVEVRPGEDLLGIPKRVLRAADSAGIKLGKSYVDLLAEIKEKAGRKVDGRRIREKFEIAISATGELIVS